VEICPPRNPSVVPDSMNWERLTGSTISTIRRARR
jgi:hypothetical protein